MLAPVRLFLLALWPSFGVLAFACSLPRRDLFWCCRMVGGLIIGFHPGRSTEVPQRPGSWQLTEAI
jgi:hypothetical protein